MPSTFAVRTSLIVGLAALLPVSARAQQMAPLPPDCDIRGPRTITVSSHRGPQAASLAVLPLNVGAGAGPFAFMSDAFPNAVARRIGSSVPRIYVPGRRVLRRRSPNDAAEARALTKQLGVGYLLDGSVTGSRDQTRVFLTLYDGFSGKEVWRRTFFYDSSGALPLEQAASIEIARRIAGALTAAEADRLRRVPTAHHGAYEWALRGDAEMDDAARASDAYRHAVSDDRSFAEGYARLALADATQLENGGDTRENVLALQKELPASAARAIALDQTSPMAWLAEARARTMSGGPRPGWGDAFERAVSLDPTDPLVLREYGRALAQAGQQERAIAVLQRAATVDPGRGELFMTLGELALGEHRDADACALLNQAIFNDALLAPAWALRAQVRSRHDDLRYAWADAETAVRLGNVLLGESAAALVDLTARDTTRALERLQDLYQQVRARGTVGVREGHAIAIALLAARQRTRALDVLEAVRPLGPWYAATLRDSSFDSVRNEPRFKRLALAQAGS
jgi:tetratricopeptide (TPR) repeat protein